MKYLKTVGLAAMAVGVLMAFVGAGSASATELTCTEPAGTKVMCPTGTVSHATSEGYLVFASSTLGNVECEFTIDYNLRGNQRNGIG